MVALPQASVPRRPGGPAWSYQHQWHREILPCPGLPEQEVVTVNGSRDQCLRVYRADPEVLITSYELARTDEDLLVAHAPLISSSSTRHSESRTGVH